MTTPTVSLRRGRSLAAVPSRARQLARTVGAPVLTVVAACLLWQLMATVSDNPLLPGVGAIADRVDEILAAGAVSTLVETVLRVALGFLLAFVAALVVGIAMGRSAWVHALLKPVVLVGLTVPGLVWALLCVIWFGLTLTSPVVAVALCAAPALVLSVEQGTRAVDAGLVEMAHVFRLSRAARLTRLWLPALTPFLLSGVRLGLSLAWKVIVLVEMFGASSGVGYEINAAFANQDVAGVLAWTVVFGVVMFGLEYGVLQTLERRVTRWRREAIV